MVISFFTQKGAILSREGQPQGLCCGGLQAGEAEKVRLADREAVAEWEAAAL